MNLEKELERLQELGVIMQDAISKTRVEVAKFKTSESETVLSFMDEMQDCIVSGKGLEDLSNKIKNYADNK